MKSALKFLLRSFILVSFIAGSLQSKSQVDHPPFWDDIAAFKKQDSINPPPKHAILFVGSSSFTKWTDVQSYFPGYTIINRGFGGSSLPDVIRYAPDIIFPYNPKQVVIYCGENDLAGSDTLSAETVYYRFMQLFQLIRNQFPQVNILYISLKPSPSRNQLRPKMVMANKMIRSFLEHQSNATFIDVFSKMLNTSGNPIEAIYIEDRLHMNAKGYAIWQKAIQPHLLKN